MKKRILALMLALLGLCLVLFACDDQADGDGAYPSPSKLVALGLEAKPYNINQKYEVKASAAISKQSGWNGMTRDHTGKYIYDPDQITAFAYYTVQDKYVRLERVENGEDFTFSALFSDTVEDIIFYAVYCTHGDDCVLGKGDLVSQGTRVSCATPVASTAEEFKTYIRQKDSQGNSVSFALGADIDLGGEEWAPVDFIGATIWGMGYTVSNFKVTATEQNNVGLIGTLSGTVRDLNITNATVSGRSEGGNIAILAGTVKNVADKGYVGRVFNVSVNGDVSAPYYSCVGGLVGRNEGGMIADCTSFATVRGKEYVGGVIGHATINNNDALQLAAAACLKGCVNEGEVSGKNCVGGLVGYLGTGTASVVLTDLTNNGDVTGTVSVGGLFGHVKSVATLEELVNNALVTGDAMGSKVGGIFGSSESVSLISYCENKADISGGTYVGGVCGYAPGATLQTDGIENNSNVSGCSYVGGFAGYIATISAAVNNGMITTTGVSADGLAVLGGVVGYCSSATNCVNNADVVTSVKGNYVGGIAGKVVLSGSDKLNGNKNYGTVSGVGTGIGGIAGFVGTAAGGNAVYAVSDNQNTGEVGGADRVGGIFGEVNASAYIAVTLLTNMGEVIATGDCAGGIVGYARRLSLVSFCENKADITGLNYVGGIAGDANGTNIKMGGAANYNTITGVTYVGGIAGVAGVIEDAANSGTIAWPGTSEPSEAHVGGIAGQYTNLINCTDNIESLMAE